MPPSATEARDHPHLLRVSTATLNPPLGQDALDVDPSGWLCAATRSGFLHVCVVPHLPKLNVIHYFLEQHDGLSSQMFACDNIAVTGRL